MVQRYSSREEAQFHAIEQQQQTDDATFWPNGYRYDDFPSILRSMRNYKGIWIYRNADVIEGTAVVMHHPDGFDRSYTVLSQTNGEWYTDFPEPPYPLYQRDEWAKAETVYVCEGERTSDVVEALGLPATTSLGGPTRAKLAVWTPLKGKHVVILSDYDDKGWNYAREVAQLCLGIGALSARIVMFPGVKVGEGPCEWIDNVRATSGDEAVLPELQKLVDAAVPEEYVPPVPEPPKGQQLELQSLAEIKRATQQWVFDKVIPQGKLTVLMGESGVGKSLTILDIAAKVTRGLTGPHDDQPQQPGSVLLLSAEDGLAENILPRLEASNADLTKVTSISGFRERDEDTKQEMAWTFQLDRDFPFLETRLRSLQEAGANVRLVVIDPIECFLESATGKKKATIESLSARLAKLAMETNVAIVVVSNLPRSVKGTSKLAQSIRRTVDLGPFGSAARSVWMIGQDLENQNRRLLLPVKTNYCELPKSLAYQIAGGVIEWEKDAPTLTSDEYLAQCDDYVQDQKRAARVEQSQLNFAVKWLRAELSQCPLPAKTVRRNAADNDISSATLRRARSELQVRSEKYAFAGPWNWSLPETAATSSEEGQAGTETEGLDEGAQEGGHDGVQGDGHKDGLDIGFERDSEGDSEGAHEDDQPRPWPTGEKRRH